MATLLSIARAMGKNCPKMSEVFPVYHNFQVVGAKIEEFKRRRMAHLKAGANEPEIRLYEGARMDAILVAIEDLAHQQRVRIAGLDNKLNDAIDIMNDFKVKRQARLLQLGELDRSNRLMNWEVDTDDGIENAVETGFEDDIKKAAVAAAKVMQENDAQLVNESIYMSQLSHRIITAGIEAQIPFNITKNWIDAASTTEVSQYVGLDLVEKLAQLDQNMISRLAAIAEEKKEIIAKKKQQRWATERAIELKQLSCGSWYHDKEWQNDARTLHPDLPLPRAATVIKSDSSSFSNYSTPSFSSVETVCQYCKKNGHDMVECWELQPELRAKALKSLKKHVCNRCGKTGHHENSYWDAFPAKKASFLKWKYGDKVRL